MPIRAELRHHYGREWRTVTRPRILARAKNKCEQCGKPNRRRVWVSSVLTLNGFRRGQYWSPRRFSTKWYWSFNGQILGPVGFREMIFRDVRRIRVVLTIAHLNHVSGDDRDENLKALCQWCHLNYDLAHHHETRAARKDAARPLLTQQPPTKEATL